MNRLRENPELEETVRFDGSFVQARLVGENIYLITSKYVDLRFFDLPSYSVDGSLTRIAADEIYYIDSPGNGYNFNLISSINNFNNCLINICFKKF